MRTNNIIIDITREEGARILEEGLYLYDYANRIEGIIKQYLEAKRADDDKKYEFFATNIFISGRRGSGKTSVLLTLKQRLESDYFREKVEVLGPIDLTVNYSGLVLYILAYIKEKIYKDFKPTDCCNSTKIEALLGRIIENFPKFLKCFCKGDCGFLCEEEIEILLNQLELEFGRDFYNLIEQIFKDKKLILILDDIDLIPDNKILLRTLIELSIFLNHPNIIIVGAGDFENLKYRLFNAIKDIINTKEKEEIDLIEHMSMSLLEKIFPLLNRIELKNIDIFLLERIRLKSIVGEEDEVTLEEFLQNHPTFKWYGNIKDFISLFENLSLRELVQVLRKIQNQIKKIEEEDIIPLRDLVITNIFIDLYYEDYIQYLKFKEDLPLIKRRIYENEFVFHIENTTEAAEINFKAFRNFIYLLSEFFKRKNIDFKILGKSPLLGLIYSQSRNLSSALKIWFWELNLYCYGTIYLNPLIFLLLLIIHGYWKELQKAMKIREENFQLIEFLEDLKGHLATKKDMYTFLILFFNDLIIAQPRMRREIRDSLIIAHDVKVVNNIYILLNFFKGLILLTFFKNENINGELEDWIINKHIYATVSEISHETRFQETNFLDEAKETLKNLLNLNENENERNVIDAGVLVYRLREQEDLKNINMWDYFALALTRSVETRILKKVTRNQARLYILYYLPFLAFLMYMKRERRQLIDRIFNYIYMVAMGRYTSNGTSEDLEDLIFIKILVNQLIIFYQRETTSRTEEEIQNHIEELEIDLKETLKRWIREAFEGEERFT